MGPFPHGAPAAEITAANPAGTDGFGFVEYAHPEPAQLHQLCQTMGFTAVARHRQRKGDEGFGEGNFRALFVSIEEDQLRRGVLQPAATAA